MSKIQMWIAIAKALVQFVNNPDVSAAFKALVDIIKQFQGDKPTVGAAPVSATEEAQAVNELTALGISPDVAKDALA